MATKTAVFELSNGKEVAFEVPENYTEAEAYAGALPKLQELEAQLQNQPKPEAENPFSTGFKSGIDAGMSEIAKLLSSSQILTAANPALSNLSRTGRLEGAVDRMNEQTTQERERFEQSPEGQTIRGKAGRMIGEIAPGVAISGGAAGGFFQRMMTGAVGGAISGGIAPTSDDEIISDERKGNILAGTIFGALIPGGAKLVGEIAGFASDLYANLSSKGAKKAIQQVVTKADVDPVARAAEALDVFITPGEATKFGDLVAKEGGILLDSKGQKALRESLSIRDESLQKSIRQMIVDIAPDNPVRAQTIKEGYQVLTQSRFKPELASRLEDNAVLGPLWRKLPRQTGYKSELAALPENSMAQLDVFQKYLREHATQLQKTKPSAAKAVRDERKKLLDFMDVTFPEYALARREASLNITREKLEKGLSAIRGNVASETGELIPSATQFYRKFLQSDDAFQDVVRNLGSNDAAAIKAQQLRIVLGAIDQSPLRKVFTSDNPTRNARTFGLGRAGLVASEYIGVAREQFHQGVVDFITDPNMSHELLADAAALAQKEANKETVEQVLSELVRVISRGGSLANEPE